MPSPPALKKNGRPPIYSDDLANRFLAALASGRSENEICKHHGMPSRSVIQRWRAGVPGFEIKYARAREDGCHVLASQVIDIADEKPPADLDAGQLAAWEQQRKARIDARKWFASKVMPRVYGDRVAVDHTVNLAPEQMSDAQLALIASRRGIVIDMEPIQPDGGE